MRILVTGGNRGVGLGVAHAALGRGDEVEVVYRTPTVELDMLQAQYPALSMLQLDLTAPSAEDVLAEWHADEPLDLLVNNAGVANPAGGTFIVGSQQVNEVDRDGAMLCYLNNAVAPFVVTRASLSRLRKSSAEPGATVAMVSSRTGTFEGAKAGGQYMYGASKAALNWMTAALAVDLAPIMLFAMSPGWVATRTGGASGTRTIEEGGQTVLDLAASLTPAESGWFFNYTGDHLI
jgi:NAD(P)-dependent dehydrogenase (short-subunit alcohol dehydrogenase family)